ncbi:hypothetical protein [Sphingomonas sp. Root241]|uniref:hypothetical protein n=1 Tax=Sphingomonas sp. Root241 TaxID=1736501 RepID=UPI0006F5159A|nr:hypothetical protein [Sphingomonas sp. Root241]KRC81291.1 hypothetical protein ASE13_02490 [Sphingomonas sp. Root241]
MSASDEVDEMHLTPGGRVQGSSKIDFAGWTHVDPPSDRLLSVSFREYMSSSFSPMDLSADETKHGSDADILAALEKHGVEPRPGADRYRGWPEFLRTIGYKRKVS